MPCRSSSRQTVLWATVKPCPASRCAAISAQGDVRRLVNQRQDFLGMGLDPVRAVVTALRPRPDIARPPPPIHPFDRRRGRNPEAARRRAPRQAAVNRRYKPFSKIIGKSFVMQAGLLHQPTS